MYSYNSAGSVSGTSSSMSAFATAYFIFLAVVAVLYIATYWRIFSKAGKPGWAAIIPFYNLYVFLKLIGRPGWWLILYFIPFVNIVISFINALDLAKVFGRSTLFGIFGLWIFSIIGYPILAFGKSTYTAPGEPVAPVAPVAPVVPPATPGAAA